MMSLSVGTYDEGRFKCDDTWVFRSMDNMPTRYRRLCECLIALFHMHGSIPAVFPPLGSCMRNGFNYSIFLFNLTQHKDYDNKPMISISVVEDMIDTGPAAITSYHAYYLVTDVGGVYERHERAVVMLDAAADENGYARIHGVGMRTQVSVDTHYFLEYGFVGDSDEFDG